MFSPSMACFSVCSLLFGSMMDFFVTAKNCPPVEMASRLFPSFISPLPIAAMLWSLPPNTGMPAGRPVSFAVTAVTAPYLVEVGIIFGKRFLLISIVLIIFFDQVFLV